MALGLALGAWIEWRATGVSDRGRPDYWSEVAEAPGLSFCGLVFQSALAPTVLLGIGRDAAYVADRIHECAAGDAPRPHESNPPRGVGWPYREPGGSGAE